MTKKILAVLALCLLVPFSAGALFFKPSAHFYSVKTEHFVIHYTAPVAPVARDLADIAERVHARMTEKLNWKPWGRTQLVLVDQNDQANGLTTVLPVNTILLHVAPPDADLSLDYYRNYLELLFIHEFTHVLHIDQHHKWATPPHLLFGKIIAPNGLTPGWMREGIAAWQESVETDFGRANSSYADMILRSAVLEEKFPHIDEVAGSGLAWPGPDSQYMYGVKFFQWLSGKFGEDKIREYMERYSSSLWLFSLNIKAQKVFGESFYRLWKDWQVDLQKRYQDMKAQVEAKGVTPFEPLIKSKRDQLSYPTPLPDGNGYAYIQKGNHDSPRVVIVDRTTKKPAVIKRGTWGQMSFSSDSQWLAFSSLGSVESYTSYSDVYIYDRKSKTVRRLFEKGKLKKSLRANDPDFSPLDGGKRWLLMVRTEVGTDNLYVYDIKKQTGHYLTTAPLYTQFSNPRFSPDGKTIVVSRHDHQGHRDIVLYSNTGKEIAKITNDKALDNHPVWAPGGKAIYFDSDRTGIANIYRYDLATKKTAQVSNVVTGVYQPQVTGAGDLLVRYYSAKGFDVYRVGLNASPAPKKVAVLDADTLQAGEPGLGSESVLLENGMPGNAAVPPAKTVARNPKVEKRAEKAAEKASAPEKNEEAVKKEESSVYGPLLEGKPRPEFDQTLLPGSHRYSAFPDLFIPRYVVPGFALSGNALLFGAATGRFDPLYRHAWSAYANYQTDAAFVSGGAGYSYLRFNPIISVGALRYALNWGDQGSGTNFFEERDQFYLSVGGVIRGRHALSGGYFYELRDNISAIPATQAFVFDQNAGLRFGYSYTNVKAYPYSIGPESGMVFRSGLEVTNSVLTSSQINEREILTMDSRFYIPMPWKHHHTFAIRAAGGWAEGDAEQLGGSFTFGGPFGEGSLAVYNPRLFAFRGLPGIIYAADRALLFSGEYRFPLAIVERGPGTMPVFLNQLHMTLFTDYGDAWGRNAKTFSNFFDTFLMSVGAELQADLTLGYGLPVTGRLGYGILVVNKNLVVGTTALSSLTDSLTGMAVANGNLYFQLGTSF